MTRIFVHSQLTGLGAELDHSTWHGPFTVKFRSPSQEVLLHKIDLPITGHVAGGLGPLGRVPMTSACMFPFASTHEFWYGTS